VGVFGFTTPGAKIVVCTIQQIKKPGAWFLHPVEYKSGNIT